MRTVNAEETEINPNGIENVVSENGTADGKKSDILAFFDFDSDAKDDVLSGINAKAMINGTNYSIVTEEEDYSGGYLHLGGNTFLDVKNVEGKSVLEGNSGNLTISYWSKTENTGSYNGWAFYAAKDAAAPSGNNEHYLGCMDRKTTLCVERYDTSPDVGRQQVNSINNLIADKWRHVVIVATSDKTKVYIDGQLKSEVSSTVDLSSLFAEDSILQIGKANWANGEYYTGAIDDFIVYDRALSEKEILDLSANDIALMNCEISITKKITVPRKSTDSIIVDMPISVDYEDIIVKFQAQDESVATVKADETDKTKINVTGIKAGETVVKTVVSCGGNQKRSFYTKVRVSAALDASAEETLADDGFTPLEKIILKKTETDILSLQLPQKVEGDAEKLVSYTSNDSEIAIVTGEGEVTGVSEGKTTITTTITIGKTSVSRETTVYVIPKGLIASYSFERNIVNEGGYSKAVPFVRDGEIKQEEDIIYEKGIFGEAIRLGEHGVKLNTLNIGNDFTFSMWLKPDNVKFNINKQVVYFGSEGKWMNIAGNNGSSRLKVWARGGIYQYTELIYNPVLTEGWQNFTVVGTDGKFELYKNGIYVDVTDSNNPLSGMNQDIIVGTMGGDDKKFTGLVDEVRVYNKALSREDVFNQYEKFREYFEENVDKKLNMEFILDNNVNENEVKYDLDLPTKIDDMDITWQSSNPDVIANDGTIKKAQNAEISLTATISIGVMTTTRKFAVKTIDLTKEMTTELSELMEKAKNANTAGWSDSAMKYLSESVSKAENAKTYDAVKTVMKRLKYAVKGEKEPYPGNPVHYCIDDGFAKDSAEWDYVFFGSYPQSEVTDEELIKLIDADAEKIGVKTDVGVDVWVNGEKYRRICQNDTNDPWGAGSQFNSGRWSDVSYMLGTLYRYYKYEPIKWRVLSNDGESLFLIADQALDCKSFDLPTEWDKCNMRKWLNKNFYQSAFNDLEKDAIIKKSVVDFNSNGVTKDKIQLISLEEITNSQFGFCTRRHDTQNVYFESDSRHFDVSTYAFARGARNNDRFWAYLRTHIPKGIEDIMGWDNKGEVREVEGGGVWYGFDDAIVPTLNVKLNSDEWVLSRDRSGDLDVAILEKYDFDEYIYRSNYYIDKTDFEQYTLGKQTPSKNLTDAGKDLGYETSIRIWDGLGWASDLVDDGPLSTVDNLAIEPKQVYSAILFDLLEVSISDQLLSKDAKDIESIVKKEKKYVSKAKKWMEKKWNIDITTEWNNMTETQKISLMDYTAEWLDENSGLDNIGSFLKGANWIFDKIETVDDFYSRLLSAYQLHQSSEEMKMILNQIYEDSQSTNNKHLKAALADCVSIVNASTEELEQKIVLDEVIMSGIRTAQYMTKIFLWKEIKTKIMFEFPPIAIIMGAYKAINGMSNFMFNTGKAKEQYLKMLALCNIEDLFDQSYWNVKYDFQNDSTKKNAKNYLCMVNLMARAKYKDYDAAYSYVDINEKSRFNQFMKILGREAKNMDEFKADIRSEQRESREHYSLLSKEWLNVLKDEYPKDLFDYFFYKYSLPESEAKKVMKIACPVNVYLYDESNNLVAFVEDEKVSCLSENIGVVRDGDEKTFLFFDNQNYQVKYMGADEGTMDISIQEYDGTEEIKRYVNYYDIDLEKDLEYVMEIVEKEGVVSESNFKVDEILI